MGMGIFLIWLILSGCVAAYASHKGHSAVGMFFVSLLLSPLARVRYRAGPSAERRGFRDPANPQRQDAQVPHVC